MASTSREITIQIIAALGAAAIIAWYGKSQASKSTADSSANQQKTAIAIPNGYGSIDDGSPSGQDPTSSSLGVPAVTPFNLGATDPQSGLVGAANLNSVLNLPVGTVNGPPGLDTQNLQIIDSGAVPPAM